MTEETKESRVVGKHVLETLTVGMYADNRIIFREYIQNAADAIDKAVAVGILNNREEGQIKITIDNEKREINIRDNGIGIPNEEVSHGLGDIGNSQKIHTENRGFRGIGRLGGLAYCKELQFITSYQGEDCKTIMVWDCDELKRYLQPHEGQDMSVIEVVDAVTILDKQSEQVDEHYFEVILTGITKGHDKLLDIDDVRDYLSQVAPVPFNCQKLPVLKTVNEKLITLGKEPEEFNIFLYHKQDYIEQIYKPYQLSVRISDKKGEDNTDLIKGIELFDSYKDDSSLFFLGWYSITDLRGMIKDQKVNGLRVRKGNIQIGNNRTLDSFFGSESNHRFNRWFVGEIYVFDDNLLPNGQRDDFEQNDAFFRFKEEAEKTTIKKLVKLPYDSSKARSNEKIIRESLGGIKEIEQEIASGVTDTRKEQLLEKRIQIEQKVKRINTTSRSKTPLATTQKNTKIAQPVVYREKEAIPNSIAETRVTISVQNTKIAGKTATTVINDGHEAKLEKTQNEKETLLNQLQDLGEKIQHIEKRPTDEIPSSYSKDVRKVVRIIFEVIDRELPEDLAKELKVHINEELKQHKGKKEKR